MRGEMHRSMISSSIAFHHLTFFGEVEVCLGESFFSGADDESVLFEDIFPLLRRGEVETSIR